MTTKIYATDEFVRDRGYLHLTPAGWIRCDAVPFPADRVETWLYEMDQPEEDAKEMDCLTRLWISDAKSAEEIEQLRAKFGDPVPPAKDRKITLLSRV